MLRLLRVTAVFVIGFGAVTAAAVYGSRLPDLPVCVTISNSRSGDLLIFDMLRDQLRPERRYSPLRTPMSEDSSLAVTVREIPDKHRLYQMTLDLPNRDDDPILEEAVFQPYETWYGDRVRFSSDQEQIAYLWRENADAEEQLTVYNIADGTRRTGSLAGISGRSDGARLLSWSGGDRYLTLLAAFEPMGSTYHLWSVEAMELVTFPEEIAPLASGSWSPQGSVFAAVTQPVERKRQLVLFSSEEPDKIVSVPLENDITAGIAWSPDGQQVMLTRRSLSIRNGQPVWQWYFDRFSVDGMLLQQNIQGQYLAQIDPAQNLIFAPDIMPGFWSADSQSWIFTRNNPDDNLAHLARLDTRTGAIEVIEQGILASMLQQVFFLPTPSFWYSSNAYMPDNTQLMLPLWRDDALTLEYVNLEQNRRLVLLEGASRLLYEAVQNYLWMFSWTGDYFVIPFIDGEGEQHLRILRRDDASLVADVSGMDSLLNVRYMGRWVGFTAWRDGAATLELVDLETGAHRQLLSGVDDVRTWDSRISPDQRHLALVLWETNRTASVGRARLYVVSLEDGQIYQFDDSAYSYPLWSPDGTMLAYLYVHGGRGTGLRVVNTDGETLQQSILPRGMLSERSLYAWSRCESDPDRF